MRKHREDLPILAILKSEITLAMSFSKVSFTLAVFDNLIILIKVQRLVRQVLMIQCHFFFKNFLLLSLLLLTFYLELEKIYIALQKITV